MDSIIREYILYYLGYLIFDAAVMFVTGLTVLSEPINFGRLPIYALLTGLVVALSRWYLDPFGFGLHIFATAAGSTVIANRVFPMSIRTAFLSTLLGLSVLSATEYLCYPFFIRFWQDPNYVENIYTDIVSGWAIILLLILFNIGVHYARKNQGN
ncbi:hypothetical protein H1S01_13155 [Heliobacterium chlorum]|uniref:Uncharacterized protein n=1 Tax=Heliobacterium chlorum TaxID=2698 RepID=A0ABR7T6I3_HELCL|nr:hypothetical protein [Heliobacterium chlorum]MBC9785454.1 hypothetical protein [Heliobacterium chlorum]